LIELSNYGIDSADLIVEMGRQFYAYHHVQANF